MIAIVDYGLGNISAFANIYKRLNVPFVAAKTPQELKQAQKLILPGVGAFDYAMNKLNSSGMRELLDEMVLEGNVPILGVCVGMQMMASKSEEGEVKGLDWIPGSVKLIDSSKLKHKPTIPHMGWNQVIPKKELQIFENVEREQGFYFLHSYFFECETEEDILATSKYADEFASAVHRANIYGFQFHPEKSLTNGVNLLKNFANI